jgi:hypothetical protein
MPNRNHIKNKDVSMIPVLEPRLISKDVDSRLFTVFSCFQKNSVQNARFRHIILEWILKYCWRTSNFFRRDPDLHRWPTWRIWWPWWRSTHNNEGQSYKNNDHLNRPQPLVKDTNFADYSGISTAGESKIPELQ